jgi:hypothetical protein
LRNISALDLEGLNYGYPGNDFMLLNLPLLTTLHLPAWNMPAGHLIWDSLPLLAQVDGGQFSALYGNINITNSTYPAHPLHSILDI